MFLIPVIAIAGGLGLLMLFGKRGFSSTPPAGSEPPAGFVPYAEGQVTTKNGRTYTVWVWRQNNTTQGYLVARLAGSLAWIAVSIVGNAKDTKGVPAKTNMGSDQSILSMLKADWALPS